MFRASAVKDFSSFSFLPTFLGQLLLYGEFDTGFNNHYIKEISLRSGLFHILKAG
jgi:hypothetical protein